MKKKYYIISCIFFIFNLLQTTIALQYQSDTIKKKNEDSSAKTITLNNNKDIIVGIDSISIACIKGDLALFLDEYNKDINIINKKFSDINGNEYPLIVFAVNGGNSKIVEILIENGANIESKDKYQTTPIMVAAQYGHYNIVKLLIENGTNRESKNKNKETPIMVAAQYGHYNIVKLLIENGANIESKNKNKVTPIMYAAQDGHYDIVKFLIENGANIESKNKYQKTPIMYAIKYGDYDIVKLLIENGANVNQISMFRYTPLIYAAGEGHDEIISLLISKGANLNCRNLHFRTAFIEALFFAPSVSTIQTLIDNGASFKICPITRMLADKDKNIVIKKAQQLQKTSKKNKYLIVN